MYTAVYNIYMYMYNIYVLIMCMYIICTHKHVHRKHIIYPYTCTHMPIGTYTYMPMYYIQYKLSLTTRFVYVKLYYIVVSKFLLSLLVIPASGYFIFQFLQLLLCPHNSLLISQETDS